MRVRVGLSDAQLKENWLASLSCPFPQGEGTSTATATATYFGNGEPDRVTNAGSDWVLGVDPDTSGALAILKGDDFTSPAQVIVINFAFSFFPLHRAHLYGRVFEFLVDSRA